MEPTPVDRPRRLLMGMWIFIGLSLLLILPASLIGAVFSSDNTSGENSTLTYVLLLAPFVFIAFPIAAHSFYRRQKFHAFRISAISGMILVGAALLYLASSFFK